MLLGTIARHLLPEDPKRASVTDILLGVLSTPSESVQRAASNCLPGLVAPLSQAREYLEGLIGRLVESLTRGKTYGERCVCTHTLLH